MILYRKYARITFLPYTSDIVHHQTMNINGHAIIIITIDLLKCHAWLNFHLHDWLIIIVSAARSVEYRLELSMHIAVRNYHRRLSSCSNPTRDMKLESQPYSCFVSRFINYILWSMTIIKHFNLNFNCIFFLVISTNKEYILYFLYYRT